MPIAPAFTPTKKAKSPIPSSLRLFERLVALQSQIKKKVDEEVARLDALQVPGEGFDLNTKAGALVAHLSENVNPDIVATLATVSEEERERLEKLRGDVKTATENDPLKVSEALERKAVAAERLVTLVETLVRGLDQVVVSELLKLNATADKLAGQSAKLSDALSKARVCARLAVKAGSHFGRRRTTTSPTWTRRSRLLLTQVGTIALFANKNCRAKRSVGCIGSKSSFLAMWKSRGGTLHENTPQSPRR